MRFLLLGPVAAIHDGEPVELGRRQERLLLGLLLLGAGRPMPVARLADLLWQGEPPERARKVVQTYVARLRAHLRAAGPPIVSTAGGYRIDAADVDAYEFLDLVEQARSADPVDGTALLDRALGLWRGPLLGDACPPPLRERVGAGLEQARLAALIRRAGDHLARGDHPAAVDLLAGPALDGTVHEPLVGLLMRAYTAGGSRAEALAVYDEARRRLRSGSGVDPGQSLVDERDRARRGVVRPRPRPRAVPATAPRELPAAPAGFVGREPELRRLVAAIGATGDRPTVVALHGPGGVGKSALAVVAARSVAGRFPDGQLYVDVCGSTPGVPSLTPLGALGQALRSLGVPAVDIPRTAAEAAARLRSRLAGARLVLLLDNVDDPAVPRMLMPATAGGALVLTSRSRYTTIDTDLDSTPRRCSVRPTCRRPARPWPGWPTATWSGPSARGTGCTTWSGCSPSSGRRSTSAPPSARPRPSGHSPTT